MTARLPVVTARDVIRVAEKLGFTLRRHKGGHAIYRRETDRARLVVPVHPGKTIRPGTLRAMIEDMGITPGQFGDLL